MRDYVVIDDTPYLRLSSLFPAYKLTRARAWMRNYDPTSYTELEVDGSIDEWITEEGYELCRADIDRDNPNQIQLEVVYARVLQTHGYDSAEMFKAELLRMRKKKKDAEHRSHLFN